jgi:hypothetical protein
MFIKLFRLWLILAAGGGQDNLKRDIMHIHNFNDIDIAFLTSVFTWCLMGHPLQEAKPRLGCPAARMGMLFEALLEDRASVYPDRSLEPERYLALWDSYFRVKPWRTSLDESVASFRKACDTITQVLDGNVTKATNDQELQQVYMDILRVLDSYKLQREELLDKFIANPSAYMYPGVYLERPSRWGTCPLTFDLSDANFALDVSDIGPQTGIRMTPPRWQKGNLASGFKITQNTIFEVNNYFDIDSLKNIGPLLSATDIVFFASSLFAVGRVTRS